MKRRLLLSLPIMVWCLCRSVLLPAAEKVADNAQQKTQTHYIWRKTPNYKGLHTMRNRSVKEGVIVAGNILYYYGDVDMLGVAFKEGFQPQNFTPSGCLTASYLHPLSNSVVGRLSLSGGALHGNDSARFEMATDPATGQPIRQWIGKGSFRSGFGEASAGIEYYPFPHAGLYIYAGIGLNISVIHYDFTKSNRGEGQRVSILPMLPIEIGYNIPLTHGFYLTIMAAVHQGLFDIPISNLDAYPLTKSAHFQWGDGYFMLGLSLSYRWQKCELCQLNKW